MTLFIIIITAVFSITVFSRSELFYRYQLNPYLVFKKKQYYRILTHAFLHIGWEHLIVNMIVLFSFGNALSKYFYIYSNINSTILFIGIYVGGIIISSVYSIIKHKNNSAYNAVGASGAVSAVTFACIFFDPLNKIYFFGILPIPGILFGILYLGYSYYMSKKNLDNIGHDAHFYGAVFGFLYPLFINPQLITIFINKLAGNI